MPFCPRDQMRGSPTTTRRGSCFRLAVVVSRRGTTVCGSWPPMSPGWVRVPAGIRRGATGSRTPDLFYAIEARYHLRYSPRTSRVPDSLDRNVALSVPLCGAVGLEPTSYPVGSLGRLSCALAKVDLVGLEPTTSALQKQRSTVGATSPDSRYVLETCRTGRTRRCLRRPLPARKIRVAQALICLPESHSYG